MPRVKEKIRMTIENLCRLSTVQIASVNDLEAVESGYKTSNIPPENGWSKLDYLIGGHKHFWIRGSFKTPPAEEGISYILRVNTGIQGWDATNPQGLLYLNGKMVQGLDVNHTEAFLEPDTEYILHNYFYTGDAWQPIKLSIDVAKRDVEIDGLYYDMLVPYEALDVLNENTLEYKNTLSALELTANIIDFRAPQSGEFKKSVVNAREFLRREFYDKLCTTEDKPIVHCIGHTHIDVEWLWARDQTREKIQRSFSTASALMDKYPEFKFTLSQPELYRYLREEAPEKYDELKRLEAEGRWEPEGAMWVECDCNLVSGESFVRQILQGKKFFKDEFGTESKVLLLPDVFGYSAALPQILRKSGVDYFVTSKISWNDTNTLPYDSFIWQGIDGSEIYSTFITAQEAQKDHKTNNYTTYVGHIDSKHVLGTWDRYQQKEYNTHTLMTYGHGDGGGGPTRQMLEKQRRLEKGLPGLPITKLDFIVPTLEAAKSEFDQNCQKLQRTPKWVGELYLEFHRGTYTSMAKNKRSNRKSEFALQKSEALSYTDLLFGGSYDAEGLYSTWRKVLHNQFHDILPGSSVLPVYEGTDKDYAEIKEYCDGVIDSKIASIAENVDTQGGVLVYNPLGFARGGSLTLNGETFELEKKIPAFGWSVIKDTDKTNSVCVSGLTAENDYYRLTLDESGRIISLYDKSAKREVVLSGKCANEFQIFEDYPYQYDAWEISDYYKSKMYVLSEKAKIVPVTDGTRSGFKVEKEYFDSTIVQNIWLYSKGRRIDFETEIDWHQKHQVVKIAFPLDINADKAAYEIQFGHVYRPTHENTSWDEARFEVSAHKWVDISETGYGVGLLNDCKYGFNAEGSTLKLTALKCASNPNPIADEGKHVFTYSLLPHTGSLYDAGVIQEAYALNQPFEAVKTNAHSGKLSESFSLVSVDADNIIVETVKKAEDSSDMIVRMYDAFNSRCQATVTVPEGFKSAHLCDLMENEICELDFDGSSVNIPVKNFEIVTLKFKR